MCFIYNLKSFYRTGKAWQSPETKSNLLFITSMKFNWDKFGTEPNDETISEWPPEDLK